MTSSNRIVAIAASAGFLAVAVGAFGAHMLPGILERLDPDEQAYRAKVLDTGARYHLAHAVALLALGLHRSTDAIRRRRSLLVAWWLVVGIVLFSGSLYGIALTGIRPLGMITPLGGVAWLIGWGLLALPVGPEEGA